MDWLKHSETLKTGKTIQIRPRGNSMSGRIESGQLVTITPAPASLIQKDDIVFCKVKGKYFVHLVTAVHGDRYQISNNKNHINGWIGKNAIFGKVIDIS